MRERLEAELSDRYLIERELGQGGMASVWLAHDRRHDRAVAIKVLHAELAGAIGADRFVREIRLTARLGHPSIVEVLDSGILPAIVDVPLPWYAMPYIPGESLRARLARDTQLPIDEAVRIAREVADALHVAHRQGIVHRDIKPENIILSDGKVFVVDFGIAKALLETGAERLTSTGLAIGTPMYMSPEQATAAPVDARTDQYSLAAVLYEMLVGEPPVTGPNTQAIIARRLTAPARPIRTVRPTVPEPVEAVVLRALERVPADRFPDIAAFAAELATASASIGTRDGRRVRRSGFAIGAAALVVVAAAAAWMAASGRAAPSTRGVDPTVVALYQKGMREYDRRTSTGAMEAIRSFDAAVARDSKYARGWVGLAKTYVRVYERRFDGLGITPDSVLRLAVNAADHALVADSTDAQAWAAQAVVRRNIDPTDVRPAMRAARRAIALDSTDGPAWHFLAVSQAESGNMDSALVTWREGVRRAPRYTQGLAFLALGYWWHKQFDSAAVWGDSVVGLDPSYFFGRMSLGSILSERGEQARAIAAFEAARRLSGDVEIPNALAGRAIAEARAGRLGDARATMREADSLASRYLPTPLHTAVFLGAAYAQLGDVERALSWLKRYPVQADLHFQLHLRCEPPLAVLEKEARYRAMLLPGTRVGAC
jgi:tetratricopeptide (TPR) repeat protein/predicted Ser/Thr protein kinase